MGYSAKFAFLLSVGLLAAGSAGADTFRATFVAGHPPHLPWVKLVKELYIPTVNKSLAETGKHQIEWTEAYGGSVAKVGGVLESVEAGVAEMGIVYSLFEQDKLPLQNITYVTPFGSSDLELVTRIVRELYEEIPAMRESWHRHNQVFIAPIGLDTHYLLTKFPVDSVEDLDGRKLSGAGATSNWIAPVGAVAVQGNFAVHYNNLKTGVYDGLVNFSTGAFPNKLHEVAPYATKVNFGAQLVGGISANKDWWDGLPDEVQHALLQAGELYRVKLSEMLQGFAQKAEAMMAKQGATFSELPADERKEWAQSLPNIARQWVERTEGEGLPADKVLETYMDKLRAAGVELPRQWDKE